MNWIETAVRQPITVTVGVLLVVLAGSLSFQKVSVQMTPEVDSVVIAVTTRWEGASPEEIESDIIEEQEKRLGNISGLVSMTSVSQSGMGQLRLEFRTGTDLGKALAEVDQKINEVPAYPDGVLKPEIQDIDPESVDYIAWIGLASTDPDYDPSVLFDFMDKRLRPRFERIPGISQVGVNGAREQEIHVLIDPMRLAQRGLTYDDLVSALKTNNSNYSAGRIDDGKNELRVRAVGRFRSAEDIEKLVIRRNQEGSILIRDIGRAVTSYKEPTQWVRARGHRMPFVNFQLESGANLLDTMREIKAEVRELNKKGGLLEQQAKKLGLNGTLELVQTYDSTTYVNDALELVRSNILVGGFLAILALLFFLRSVRTILVIAIAIPISVVGSVVILLGLGRSINIISLAGIAFAVGMVVDNAIVVIENIVRYLEAGHSRTRAAIDGTKEVAGAVLASTLTTLVVFFPILLIQDSAGQLFRDIALAIMSAVGLSYIVSITVIPSAAALLLERPENTNAPEPTVEPPATTRLGRLVQFIKSLFQSSERLADFIHWTLAKWYRSAALALTFAVITLLGIWAFIPPLDYLPKGNRNVVFGLLIPPPGYTLDQLSAIGDRIEERVRPAWEVAGDRFTVEKRVRDPHKKIEDQRPTITDYSGRKITPPPLDHYFLVAFDGQIFQVGISADKQRVPDAVALLNHAAAGETAPDVIAFAFQFPLFRTGGRTGSAIKVDLRGDNLNQVKDGALALMLSLFQDFGPGTVTPDPANFALPTPELRITPNDDRLRELGLTRRDLGLTVQANADGLILVRQFQIGGELKDLKIMSPASLGETPLDALMAVPLATPTGDIVDLQSVAKIERLPAPNRIKHVNRQRAISLQVTPPPGIPLETAVNIIRSKLKELQQAGAIRPDIEVTMAGSAGKLNDIKQALLGDGTLSGLTTSSLFLSFTVIYLLMVVLFQSWLQPLVIMVSVPLATLGGFMALYGVHEWSAHDPYMPVQNLDVLTILGFVILAGVVVNNAILIVHQSLNFLETGSMSPAEAIAEAVKTRVRPIFMSTLTSVGGMLPLVFSPGSGSELYRGLGSVVVGGLLVSTLFTLILVPVLLGLILKVKAPITED